MKKYSYPDDPRLKRVKFIVTEGDTFRFWEKYHNWLPLEQDSMGITFQYADFGKKKPCWASVFFYDVGGVWTAFVDAHGAYVDYHRLEKFVFDMCGMEPNPDNHCNEDNTHNHPAILALTPEQRFVGQRKDISDLEKWLNQTEKQLTF